MEEKILIGLDRLPNEILINKIYPKLSPKCLVWLNKEFYLKYHREVYSLIGNKKNNVYPGGKYSAFTRYILREEATLVLEQLLNERMKIWYNSGIYRYSQKKYKNYLYFLYQYCIDNNFSKSRKCINEMAKSVLGKKWHK